MPKTRPEFSDLKLYDMALTCALDNYLSDWEAFADDPQAAFASLAADEGIVTIWEPLENEDLEELCDAIEAGANQMLHFLKTVRG